MDSWIKSKNDNTKDKVPFILYPSPLHNTPKPAKVEAYSNKGIVYPMQTPLEQPHKRIRDFLPYIGGGLLVALAVFLTVSLASYNPNDPSFNRASLGEVHNWGGATGAFLADPIIQFLGIAAIIPILVFASWGVKTLTHRPARLLLLRFALLLLALTSAATLLAFLPPPEGWNNVGGYIGKFIKDELSFLFGEVIVVSAAAVIFLASFITAIGLSWSEWRLVGRSIFKACAYAVIGIVFGVKTISRLIGRLTRKSDTDEDEFGFNNEAPTLQTATSFEDDDDYEEERPAKAVVEKAAKPVRKAPVAQQTSFKLTEEDYELPDINLLSKPSDKKKKTIISESALAQNARLLEQVLSDFGVLGKIVKVRPGPVVTLYELEPAAGTKSSRVIGLADDIARSMSAVSARIAVVPGRNAIGIELPNANRETVLLRELLEADEYRDEELKLPLALGKNIGGAPMIVDLARMPHLLVAGTTGSGKSVAINAMILSFLYRLTPQECKFIMIDPKMLELSVYDGIPHLLAPVVTEPGKAVVALKWAVREMENRYRLMSNLGVRNIAGYNKRIQEAIRKGEVIERSVQTGFDPETGKPIIEKMPIEMTTLPFIVIIVDEMADLMLVAGKDIEASIQRLAQMARAAGIHLVMATQRPSVDVITGVIKANFPTRISFQVTSRIDSRTILGEQGAEQLLGMGDLLYMAGGGRITRSHGPFVDDKEVEKVVEYLKAQGDPVYIEEVTAEEEEGDMPMGDLDKDADLYDQAVAIVCRDKKASTSYIQRCLKIGYNRAATIIERMEREGIVGPANHVGKREVLARDRMDA